MEWRLGYYIQKRLSECSEQAKYLYDQYNENNQY